MVSKLSLRFLEMGWDSDGHHEELGSCSEGNEKLFFKGCKEGLSLSIRGKTERKPQSQ